LASTAAADRETTGRAGRGRLAAIAAAALAIVAVAAIAGVAIYRDQIAPFRTHVLIVDDKHVDMAYFLKRVRMSGQPPLSVLQALTLEEIVKSAAPAAPYVITVSEADIDRLLRDTANQGGQPLSDAEFSEWYRQQLNESGLSEAEFRDLTRSRLLMRGMLDHVAKNVPAAAEQVRIAMIALPSRTEAEAAKARLDAGAAFAELAQELNGDPDLKATGGDIGWHARAGLAPNLARIVFDILKPGEASEPVTLDDKTFALLTVTERAERELEAEGLAAARSDAFDAWYAEEFRSHKVEYHGFTNGYDSATDAWVRGQVADTRAMSGGAP
jgi:hypothetical protein